ncbi:MAG: FMN-binding protein [Clostridia bacterium]|nr:FMN-binding protein [Clostridia bacterium]
MKKYLRSIISLTAVCAIVALLMGVTNYFTAPIIKQRENDAANEALKVVLPDGEGFEKIDISKYTLPTTVDEAYSEKNGGYVFKMITAGYGSNFVIMCGIDSDGVVKGTKVISSSETLGVENEYGDKLVGVTVETVDGVDTVSGATKTTAAYKNAVKDALMSFDILGGKEVDIRDEAQILADKLNAALPQGEGKFSKEFISVRIDESVSAVYKAENGAGYVVVLGEIFVGVDSENKVVTADVDESTKTTATDTAKKLESVTLEELDITNLTALPKQIQKVFVTDEYNYVFEIRCAGYGIEGGNQWHPASGEYIFIKLSLDKENKIIDCITVSQGETDGIGSVCADESFYGQFAGKDKTNYSQIDAISGATITTNGYLKGVQAAFEAFEILNGEE